ncbi:hypothetical protein M0R45_031024 [Rubus argutus]|uniref:KIB1-4 beta-propeller domain-containing protein n=1 Tax=Rubus argutus TaxID=59490 RepID=A0AAW1WES8_RUBAR
MTNWSNLPHDVIVSIAKHLDSFEDFLAARGVDRSWRSAAIKKNFTGRSTHQVPLLLLPYKKSTTIHILAFCRPEEDNKWNMIEKSYIHGPYFLDITYFQGQLYAVDCFGNVLVCDIEDPKQAETRVVVSAMPTGLIHPCIQKLYLVELGGTLFVVSRTSKRVGFEHATDEFRAFEVPFGDGNWLDSEVKTLGNRSLFLGTNSSFAVDATKYFGCKANCIYFTSDFGEMTRGDMGIFNMTNGKIEPLLEETHYSSFPHLWIEPSF